MPCDPSPKEVLTRFFKLEHSTLALPSTEAFVKVGWRQNIFKYRVWLSVYHNATKLNSVRSAGVVYSDFWIVLDD